MPTPQLYTLPEIRRNKVWYIEYHQADRNGCRIPNTQKKLKCDLNRIKDLVAREDEAKRQLNIIKSKLGFKTIAIFNYPATPIWDALATAINIKVANVKSANPKRIEKTKQIYADTMRLFKLFLSSNQLSEIQIAQFTAVHATFFKDFLQAKKTKQGNSYRPRSINNHTGYMLALFNELQERDYVPTNPFSKLKKVAEGDPIQRAFEPWERDAIFPHLFKDETLTLAVMLIYRTALRPVELLTLKPKFFDFERGIIRLPGIDTKAKEQAQFITIPDDIRPYFQEKISVIPQNYFVFGEKLKPHPTKPAGEKSLTRRHHELILKLKKMEVLDDVKGLFLYSWKDTCALDSIREGYDIYALMKHFRHKDITTTQKYFKRAGIINETAKVSKIGMIPT